MSLISDPELSGPSPADQPRLDILSENKGIGDLLTELLELRKAKQAWEESYVKERQLQLEQEIVNAQLTIKRLRRELKATRDVVEDLTDEVADRTEDLEKNAALIRSINRLRRPNLHLHPIALRYIFEATLPSLSFLDTSPSIAGNESPWMQVNRIKKTLTLVCRSWRQASLPLMYGEIKLRRVLYLPALVRSLQLNADLRNLIWSITFAFDVPENFKEVAERGVAYIIRHCRNITQMSLPSSFIIKSVRWELPQDDGPVVNAMLSVCSNIRRLDYCDEEMIAIYSGFVPYPFRLLAAFTHLVSLSLYPSYLPTSVAEDSASLRNVEFPGLSFNRLETLQLRNKHAESYLAAIASSWNLPRLKKVIFQDVRYTEMAHNPTVYMSFFRRFGRGIHCIYLGHQSMSGLRFEERFNYRSAARCIESIIALCPSLRHFIIPSPFLSNTRILRSSLLSDKTTFHVDILLHQAFEYHHTEFDYLISPTNPNAFRSRMRLLDDDLRQFPDLPFLLPPDPQMHPNARPLVHRIYGLCIIQTSWCIFRVNPNWNGKWDGSLATLREVIPFDLYNGDTSDEEYVGNDSGSDESGWSDSDSSDLVDRDDEVDVDSLFYDRSKQITEEEALEVLSVQNDFLGD
ncbi:hypothetical protein C8Q75DRAFT_733560 [Abortiporus biennis]|nr:hypothetical protein C8Q75DRAFT_733560 [Abortiporus biennis]